MLAEMYANCIFVVRHESEECEKAQPQNFHTRHCCDPEFKACAGQEIQRTKWRRHYQKVWKEDASYKLRKTPAWVMVTPPVSPYPRFENS